MSESAMRVGWVGVGRMGLPMATYLLQGGHAVAACDRVPARVDAIAARGATRAATPADAARGAEVTFSCIPDDAALRAVALGADGVLAGAERGAIYVDTSTVSPTASAEVAAAAAARGVRYLRVGVSGNNRMAEQAALTAIASGDRGAYERVLPLLKRFGPQQFHVGDAEQARTLKLVINLMAYASIATLAEALALGRRGGLDWGEMLDVIAASAVGSPVIKAKSGDLKRRDFTPTFNCLEVRKDFGLILDAGRAAGAPLPIAALVAQAIEACIATGSAEEDYAAMAKVAERAAGLGGL